jgi:hypothetical protein
MAASLCVIAEDSVLRKATGRQRDGTAEIALVDADDH